MISLEFVVSRFAVAVAIGLTLLILRSTIDQRKGAMSEVAGVSLPIFVAAMLVFLQGDYGSLLTFGLQLAPVVQLVFLALPILLAVRLVERFRAGETLQLSDLFRVLTVTSLVMFVLTSLIEQISWPNIFVVTAIYIAGERAAACRRTERYLALAFCFGFLLSIFTAILAHTTMLDFDLGGISRSRWSGVDLRSATGSLSLLVFIGTIVSTPLVGDWARRRLTWIHQLAWRLSTWRFSIGDPSDLIFVRNLFELWHFRRGVCYLNHGSFGALPLIVRNAQQKLRIECDDEPMDFLARQLETRLLDAKFKLATWLGTKSENIALCENATAGMNEVAAWFPLSSSDEVILSDHEYGAVHRIWSRKCQRASAKLTVVTLPMPLTNPQQITDTILSACTDQTKLVVLSHITSATAIRLPVEALCPQLKQRNIATCIDGPHAILQEPVKLYRLGCDFYTASCHKWLCAPLGSGFVYVDPQWHALIEPLRLSWGRLPPNSPEQWTDELLWTGTRDPSAYLCLPTAIEFFEKFDLEQLDQRNHQLACYARRRLSELPGAEAITPEGRCWFGWMVGVWLPEGEHASLQQRLWDHYKIEVPIVRFADRYLVRVSCHQYVSTHDIDTLLRALDRELNGTVGR